MQRLTEGKTQEYPYSFSPDGKRLAFQQRGNGGSDDIFTAPFDIAPGRGDPARGPSGVRLGKAELFLGTPFDEAVPAFGSIDTCSWQDAIAQRAPAQQILTGLRPVDQPT